jgi:hypothetical protein
MKFKLSYFLFLLVLLCVLQDDNQKRDADNERRQKKEVIFQILIKDGFYDTPINETTEQ